MITVITSMGVLLTPRGLCMTATVRGSYDTKAFVSPVHPSDGHGRGPLVEYPGTTVHHKHIDLALLGKITPFWASALVLALLASRALRAPSRHLPWCVSPPGCEGGHVHRGAHGPRGQ